MSELEAWEVFRREKDGDPMRHGGSVLAPDPELAVHYARELFGRRGESLELWVVRRADIVTLDRVVCCYPDVEALVGRSADRARRLYGLVYPRDTWWVKIGFSAMNAFMAVSRRAFRVHVHPTTAVDAAARRSGLELRAHRRSGPVWQVVLYARDVS